MFPSPITPGFFHGKRGPTFGDRFGIEVPYFEEPTSPTANQIDKYPGSMAPINGVGFPFRQQALDVTNVTNEYPIVTNNGGTYQYKRWTRDIASDGAESNIASNWVDAPDNFSSSVSYRCVAGSYNLWAVKKQAAGSGLGTTVWMYGDNVGNDIVPPVGSNHFDTFQTSAGYNNQLFYMPDKGMVYTFTVGDTGALASSWGIAAYACASQSVSPASTHTYHKEIQNASWAGSNFLGRDTAGNLYFFYVDTTDSSKFKVAKIDWQLTAVEWTLDLGTTDVPSGAPWINTSFVVVRNGEELWCGETNNDNDYVYFDISAGTLNRQGTFEFDTVSGVNDSREAYAIPNDRYSNWVYLPYAVGNPQIWAGG